MKLNAMQKRQIRRKVLRYRRQLERRCNDLNFFEWVILFFKGIKQEDFKK